MSLPILATPRLRLRTLDQDDAAFYLALINDPSWLRFIPDKGIHTEQAARDAIAQGPMLMQRQLGHSIYLVELKEDGRAIGLCGLIKRDHLPAPDIGYGFLPAHWGRGYAAEAAAAVLAYARDTLGFACLLAITDPDNVVSGRMLTTLGLRLTDTGAGAGGRPTDFYRIDFPARAG
ncbi:GNAT family N-acetyltransferase [Rugamonas sp.]|uniref:GNAT family N-acetyltransferase n=1 Tax=Rugamonas sp. TaxID=1926287 RepID=UPI0025CC5786|nr:GNAT family N-acetyltransferase [Rugamonas sp.]